MSSSPRNSGPSNRYGSESDHGKRRKSFFPSLTRRDFKSSSHSPLALPTPAGTGLAYVSKPSLRGDPAGNSEFAPRSRYRDSVSSGNSSNLNGSRQNSYSKDARYASYGTKYPYTSNYHQDRTSGAYGSFSSAKRAENEMSSAYSTSRDSSSRDMVNGSSTRPEKPGFSRESWSRAERPKLHNANGGKSPGLSRFNPNSIPLSSRTGLNVLSSSVSNDYHNEHHDSYDDSSSGRWKSYSPPRTDRNERSGPIGPSGQAARFNTPKERIRSSGLTNSVGSSKRSDAYYSHRTFNSHDRFDRGRYSESLDSRSHRTTSANTREYHAKLASPLSESYYRTDTGDDSSMTTHNAPEVDHIEGDDDEDEGEEEEEDDDDDEDDDDEEEEEEEEEVPNKDEKISVELERIIAAPKKLPNLEKHEIHSEIFEIPKQKLSSSDYQDTQMHDGLLLDSEDATSSAIEYPDGCIYPQSKLESEYHQLKSLLPQDTEYLQKAASFACGKTNFSQFPFYSYNLKRFSVFHENYLHILKKNSRELKKRKLVLICKYKALAAESERRRQFMEEQLKILHPHDEEARKELEAIDIRVKNPEPEVEIAPIDPPVQTGRRGRRHGDSVTTEAEFQEILRSLKNQQNDDPVARARHVAAEIPDLILDPVERHAFKFMNSNNFVRDKSSWEKRINTDFETNFTETEHDLFCDAFCRSPKRFGEISRCMGGIRTFGECVMHYYITKKAVNYKLLVSQYKKKASNKNARRKKKVKSKILPSAASNGVSTQGESTHVDPRIEIIPLTEGKIEDIDEKMADEENSDHENLEQPERKKARLEFSLGGPSKTDHNVFLESEMETKISDEKPVLTASENLQISGESQTAHVAPIISSSDVLDESSGGDEKKSLKHITSYWSITEVESFPHLLNTYGSRWSDIAAELSTKSSTMVKNYYQRNAEKLGWVDLVSIADQQLKEDDIHKEKSREEIQKTPGLREVSKEAPIIHGHTSGEINGATPFQNQEATSWDKDSATINGLVSDRSDPLPEGSSGSIEIKSEDAATKADVQKPSIRSLLNNEATSHKNRESSSHASQRTNNLSSLLNAPSSPAPAHVADTSVDRKNNSINSLLG